MFFASELQHFQYYSKTQRPTPTENSKKAIAAGASAAAMARLGNHSGRAEAARRRIKAANAVAKAIIQELIDEAYIT